MDTQWGYWLWYGFALLFAIFAISMVVSALADPFPSKPGENRQLAIVGAMLLTAAALCYLAGMHDLNLDALLTDAVKAVPWRDVGLGLVAYLFLVWWIFGLIDQGFYEQKNGHPAPTFKRPLVDRALLICGVPIGALMAISAHMLL